MAIYSISQALADAQPYIESVSSSLLITSTERTHCVDAVSDIKILRTNLPPDNIIVAPGSRVTIYNQLVVHSRNMGMVHYLNYDKDVTLDDLYDASDLLAACAQYILEATGSFQLIL